MADFQKQHIFFVDDEPKVRQLVGETLEQAGFGVTCFATAVDCLDRLRSKRCDLLITDVKLPEISGIELLTAVKGFMPALPVLIVTGFGDIPMAVSAMKAGANDFIEKPLKRQILLSAVDTILKQIKPADAVLQIKLTRAEMKVLNLILQGKTNKETANLLHRSMSTVEVHRKHIMNKFGVDNIVDLVKRAAALGLIDPNAKK
jgi:two-component system response regulator FixJ